MKRRIVLVGEYIGDHERIGICGCVAVGLYGK